MAAKAAKGNRLAKGFSLPKVEKKTRVPEEVAAAFVDGGGHEDPASLPVESKKRALVSVPRSVAAEPAPSLERAAPKSSKLRRASRGERVPVYLPPAMAEELRVRCAKERRSVSDAVTAAVGAWLKEG